MSFALYLSLDERTSFVVREVWNHLFRTGPSGASVDTGTPPHVTLAGCDVLDVAAFGPELAKFAAETKPLQIAFGAIGFFPSSGTLFLAPVVTAELLEVHSRLQSAIARHCSDALSYCAPGHWIPHCTLAASLALHRMGEAVEYAAGINLSLPAQLEQVELIEVPSRTVFSYPLSGNRV